MKNIVNGAIAFGVIGWLGYTLAAPQPCERIARSAAPVRGALTIVRMVSQNWISQEARIDLISDSIWIDEQLQKAVGTTFYGSPKCRPD